MHQARGFPASETPLKALVISFENFWLVRAVLSATGLFSVYQLKKFCLLPASASVSVSASASASEPKIGGKTDGSGKTGLIGPSLQTSLQPVALSQRASSLLPLREGFWEES